jgi:hypothetical protein
MRKIVSILSAAVLTLTLCACSSGSSTSSITVAGSTTCLPIAEIAAEGFKEETGIDLGEVRYLGSQPWPFPASLMMAFKAQALSTDILVDGEETETARWVTRDEYTIELSEGRMEAPGKSTIARYMIEEWYGREL